MHVRYLPVLGTRFLEEGSSDFLGSLADVLIHPDTGVIEGVFVDVPHAFHSVHLFCDGVDIIHWGKDITVRTRDVLSPAEDRIRLKSLLDDSRTMIGQRIRTQRGKYLGRCSDVQFSTKSMKVEWLFPRKWFHWGVPIPISEISEVRRDAIVIRDPLSPKKQAVTKKKTPIGSLDPLGEISRPSPSRVSHRK